LFQKGGRHGSVREEKAVGRRCTKAVAIRTPVPKCLEMKRNWCGTGNRGKRFATMGKEHAGQDQHDQAARFEGSIPAVLTVRIRMRAKTWRGVL
jgi:hypothetical protein